MLSHMCCPPGGKLHLASGSCRAAVIGPWLNVLILVCIAV